MVTPSTYWTPISSPTAHRFSGPFQVHFSLPFHFILPNILFDEKCFFVILLLLVHFSQTFNSFFYKHGPLATLSMSSSEWHNLSAVWSSNKKTFHYSELLSLEPIQTYKWKFPHCHFRTIEMISPKFPPPITQGQKACFHLITKTKLNSVALVRERTIPTERPPPVGEVSVNFCG